MAKILGLPKLSPTMDEGTLVSWEKKEGDKVEIDDLLAEVETDKATMEFRSFDAGVLLKILVPAGETLAPDTPVAILGEPGEDISELLAQAQKGAAASEAPQAEPEQTPVPSASAAVAQPAPTNNGRVLASPLVRKIAREKNIDLSTVSGSGPHGRIIKRDLAHRPTAVLQRAPVVEGDQVEPVSQMRKTIARRLTESKRDIPHYYLTIDCDVEPLMDARKRINKELEKDGEKISLNDLIIKACASALRRHPQVNSSFRGDSVVRYSRVDISVAVAIPDGLMTPVVRNADQKGALQISREVKELAGRARDKKLKPEEFTDGTFSVSNLGMFGIESFTAVINPPEGAILAVGTIRSEPVVKGNAVVPGKRMRMTMSCDHRVIDGAVGAQFLALLKKFIETPAMMLT